MRPLPVSAVPRASARDRLLAAADELFYKEGINNVGIDRVIEQAGVAKASLYAPSAARTSWCALTCRLATKCARPECSSASLGTAARASACSPSSTVSRRPSRSPATAVAPSFARTPKCRRGVGPDGLRHRARLAARAVHNARRRGRCAQPCGAFAAAHAALRRRRDRSADGWRRRRGSCGARAGREPARRCDFARPGKQARLKGTGAPPSPATAMRARAHQVSGPGLLPLDVALLNEVSRSCHSRAAAHGRD